MEYRRTRIKGATYFFTVVTHRRKPLFRDPEAVDILREAISHVRENHPFEVLAGVVLPDHLHCIWTMPEGDCDFSIRWQLIKTRFTRKFNAKGGSAVWQKRYWEHMIRNDEDLIRHVEYIHYNPVKHGYAKSPLEWPHSSFRRFAEQGLYSPEWGKGEAIILPEGIGME